MVLVTKGNRNRIVHSGLFGLQQYPRKLPHGRHPDGISIIALAPQFLEEVSVAMSTFIMQSRSDLATGGGPSRTLIITLSTTIPGVIIVSVLGLAIYQCRRRRFSFLNRGITPIDDEEIESWRTERIEEKMAHSAQAVSARSHQPSMSASSIQKPPSILVYGRDTHFNSRPSMERSPGLGRTSVDVPAPVIAVAPNARLGLTDEMVQGDDAFVPRIKRQPSRLAKSQPPASPGKHQHKRSTNSHSSLHAAWYGYQEESQYAQTPVRHFSERQPQTPPPRGHRPNILAYPDSSIPPYSSHDEEVFHGGLSPRPMLHQSDIGRAIG
ncbi:hypothetical protein NLU13_1829 [Sarocladium strictum]|uniref:Uncharacterized protein n=1 Tax=Sarocladium strictum TaxID=5046 RepID=A0AA39GRN9_SARSR|nr:hypothetical protein NLU13_1829 [Sarocladium strictum]